MTALTEPEKQLVQVVEAGGILDLTNAPDRSIRAWVIRDVLRGVLAPQPDPRGLRVREAQVSGELDLMDIRTTVPLELESCAFTDTINLDRAHISSLDLTGSNLHSLSGWYLACEHNVTLAGVICANGLELAHARIGGQLSLTDAILTNTDGPALNADGIHTDGTVFLNEDFHATSTSEIGTIRLLAARIGGQLDLSGATVSNTAGPAIYADHIKTQGDTLLDNCRGTGRSDLGTLSLIEAQLDRDLKLSTTTLVNDAGPALNADGIQIKGNAFIDDGFHAVGRGTRGVVRLPGARITGQLSLDGARFTTHDSHLTLDLGGARVDDELVVDIETLVADESFRLDCDGLQYAAAPRRARRHDSSLPGPQIPLTNWLILLRERTLSYAAQPYQQLAATHRAAGHERDARKVLIAQQVDLRARGQIGGPLTKTWHRLSGLTIGYGYRPARALLGLLLTVLLGLGIVLTATAMNLTTHTKDRPPGNCTLTEHVGLAADLAIPLVKTGGQQRCEFMPAKSGSDWFIAAGWLTQFLGWAFATLFVAGFTGLIRKQ